MIDKRPQADRLLIAELTGEAGHRARWRELTEYEEAAAVAALRELASGRADLLAEVAGVLEGTSEGKLNEPLKRQAAMLCRNAGADPEAIPGVDRGGPPARGRGEAAPVLRRAARRGSAALAAAERPASARDQLRVAAALRSLT